MMDSLSRTLPSKDYYVTRIKDGKQFAWFRGNDGHGEWKPLTEELKAGNTPKLMTFGETKNWFSDVTAYQWQGNPYAAPATLARFVVKVYTRTPKRGTPKTWAIVDTQDNAWFHLAGWKQIDFTSEREANSECHRLNEYYKKIGLAE